MHEISKEELKRYGNDWMTRDQVMEKKIREVTNKEAIEILESLKGKVGCWNCWGYSRKHIDEEINKLKQ